MAGTSPAMTTMSALPVEALHGLELGEGTIDGGAAFFLGRLAHLIDLRAVENRDPVLGALILAAAVARVVAQADGVAVFIAELDERRVGDERAADAARIAQVGAQKLEHLVLVFDRVLVRINLPRVVRLVE